MNSKEIEEKALESLCYYDDRNPNNNNDLLDAEDVPEPRGKCFCDNCFYGRDSLALIILDFLGASPNLPKPVRID